MRARAVSVAAVAALSLLAAACGGRPSATPPVASATTAATTTTTAPPQAAMVAFSHCMRSHGVANFPDPQHIGRNVKLTIHQAVGANPRFQAAQNACSHLLPGGPTPETPQQIHKQLVDALSFARCMRSHGLSRFPDPNSQGQLTVQMVQAQGIDVHSTAVLHVVQTCLPASHGALTPAKVREAINSAGG